MKDAVLFLNVRTLETLNYKEMHVISRARSPFSSLPAATVFSTTSCSVGHMYNEYFNKRTEYLVNILKDEKKRRKTQ